MEYLNVEIKARCNDHSFARRYLVSKNAEFIGTDMQTDTYFNVKHGRLKLREGNIENNLIQYNRQDQAGPKNSAFRLVKIEDSAGLKEALTASLGIKMIVEKEREIYYIGNVKFHLDRVKNLGMFIEIEAGNKIVDLGEEELRQQCERYMKEMQIREEGLVERSYSDLMEARNFQ